VPGCHVTKHAAGKAFSPVIDSVDNGCRHACIRPSLWLCRMLGVLAMHTGMVLVLQTLMLMSFEPTSRGGTAIMAIMLGE